MTENQQKLDELLGKIKTLGSRAKEVRSSFGEPILDRFLSRANRTLSKLGDGNGVRQPQPPQQPQLEMRRTCPKCGRSFNEEAKFCSDCGFDFQEEARRQLKEGFEREKLERNSRMGVITGG